MEGGFISWKLKVLHANFHEPWKLVCGLISINGEGFFAKVPEGGCRTAGWFRLSSRVFLQNNKETHNLDRLPAHRTAGSGWRCGPLPGQGIGQESWGKDQDSRSGQHFDEYAEEDREWWLGRRPSRGKPFTQEIQFNFDLAAVGSSCSFQWGLHRWRSETQCPLANQSIGKLAISFTLVFRGHPRLARFLHISPVTQGFKSPAKTFSGRAAVTAFSEL